MKKFLTFTFILLSTLTTYSQQVVNIENRLYDTKDTGWSGNAKLMFNLVQNVNQVITLGNKIFVQHNKDIHTYLLMNEVNFVQANSVNLNYNTFQHLRYKRNMKTWLNGEAFAQSQFNQQLGIKFRGLLGAGPRIRIFDADSMKLFISPMWMYEYEENSNENEKHVKNRLNLYVSFLFFKEKNIGFDLVCYYQPDMINPEDYRLLSEFKADLFLTRKLNFRFSFSQNFNSQPPDNIPKNSFSIRNSFLYRF